MASSDDAHDPEWRLEGVSWDADTMQASPKDTGSGGRAGTTPPGRSANTSCQVEGCCALLPLRSYYQRQHICEEHFRAVVITEPSGRLSRFCQQCTKLEPLANFDGERRSCRDSLVRRNQRRQGRRAGSRRARPAKKAPASAAARAAPAAAGSGDSTTHVARTSSPSGATEASPPEEVPGSVQRPKRARSDPDTSPPPLSAGYWLQSAAAPESGSFSAAGSGSSPAVLPAHLLGAIEQLEALEPVLAAPQLPAGQHASQLLPHAGHAAAHHSQLHPSGHQTYQLQHQPGGQLGAAAPHLSLVGMSAAQLGTLASFDVDQLLTIDADQLADLLLAGHTAAPLPAAASAAAPHTGWALPALAPQQQALYQLPAQVAPQLHAPHLAGVPVAPAPAAAHTLPPLSSAYAAPQHLPMQAAPFAQPATGRPTAAPAAPGTAGGAPATNDVAAFAASFFGDWPASSPEEAELDVLLDCFEPLYDEVRLSLKLYGVHPDQLPAALRAELLGALTVPPTPAQAAIRAGCVHLTLTALIDAEERHRLLAPGAAATVLARLLPLLQQLPAQRAALQLGQGSAGSAALLAAPPGGGPAALLSLQLGEGSAGGLPPALEVQRPLATTVSACRGFFRLRCPHGLLWGAGGLKALCRRAGTGHVPLSLSLAVAGKQAAPQSPRGTSPSPEEEEGEEVWASSEDEATDDEADCNPEERVEVDAWVPFEPALAEQRGAAAAGGDTPLWQAGWGLYEFELARGTLLGPAVPVLVLPDAHAAAAAELARLSPGPMAATVLRLAALVLRYLEQREGATGPQAAAAFQARYPPLAVARLGAAARQLLALAQRAGWPALAALLQPAAIADGWHPARAALMADPQLLVAAAPAVAAPAQPAFGQRVTATPPPPSAAGGPSAQPAAQVEQEAVHVVGTLLPAPAPAVLPPGQHNQPSSSGDSPRKPGSGSSGKAAAGSSKELEAQLPELSEGDSLRRVMRPAVLCAATAAVAGCVLGVGWALGAGYF